MRRSLKIIALRRCFFNNNKVKLRIIYACENASKTSDADPLQMPTLVKESFDIAAMKVTLKITHGARTVCVFNHCEL
jgi:hypothetical protein